MPFHISEVNLVDLHTHSTANDGRWRPATLARAAANLGISVIALTDHDTTAAVGEFAQEARSAGCIPVPGVEVSCWWNDSIYHVLCLGVDINSPAMIGILHDVWQESVAVAREAASDLNRRGFILDGLERVRRGAFLPIDVLVAALQKGLAPTFPGVVERLVGQMGLSFAAGTPMERAVSACHAAGGVAVLAHPGRAEFGFTVAGPVEIGAMAEKTGLDGIEVYHWSHGVAEVELYGRLAAERGLLVSCGSDSHGPSSSRPLRGWPARLCRPLLERCGIEVGP